VRNTAHAELALNSCWDGAAPERCTRRTHTYELPCLTLRSVSKDSRKRPRF
jgi:hypothetical protein